MAQKCVLCGSTLDAETKKPLAGAVIALHDLNRFTTSDEAGVFFLRNLPGSETTVTISLLGYQTRTETTMLSEQATTVLQAALNSSSINLAEVSVNGFHTHQQKQIGRLDMRLRPILNSQEMLPMVPGLSMGQHASGGKAEQIFLHGFDIDHGTDIQLTADGIPVNMVSHAHGQGYADLHFLIPELVETVNFEKGPYHADEGNLVTAGWVDFRTREVLERSLAKVKAGQYGTARAVAAIDLLSPVARSQGQSAYLATEYSYSDSYFDAPQYFNRFNLQGRYNQNIGQQSRLSVIGSHFWSRWIHLVFLKTKCQRHA